MSNKKAIKSKVVFTDQTIKERYQELDKIMAKEAPRLQQGKTISILQLPECQHKTKLMNITENPAKARICVVAVKSKDKQGWQVYAGYPDKDELTEKAKEVDQPFLMPLDFVWLCENVHDAEQVLFMGDLLPQHIAEQLFPDWKGLEYKA